MAIDETGSISRWAGALVAAVTAIALGLLWLYREGRSAGSAEQEAIALAKRVDLLEQQLRELTQLAHRQHPEP